MNETVRSILGRKGRKIWSVAPDATVYDAIALMATKGIGAVLVISEGNLIGIVSEQDYVRKVILQGRYSKETRVTDIMTSNPIFEKEFFNFYLVFRAEITGRPLRRLEAHFLKFGGGGGGQAAQHQVHRIQSQLRRIDEKILSEHESHVEPKRRTYDSAAGAWADSSIRCVLETAASRDRTYRLVRVQECG